MTKPGRDRVRRLVQDKVRETEELLGETHVLVALLGAGGEGLEERQSLASLLEERGIETLILDEYEEILDAPSIYEEELLEDPNTDLVFLSLESWGTATELGQFVGRPQIARKLRILVGREYHPLHGEEAGYPQDVLLTHLAVYGHVYAVSDSEASFPTRQEVILRLAERYKRLKAQGRIQR